MASDLTDTYMPPDCDADQMRRYPRRLPAEILIIFHQACDARDFEVAWELLNALEAMAKRMPILPRSSNRRAKESLAAAHERLWHIRQSHVQNLW
jgi:hypothetical protein